MLFNSLTYVAFLLIIASLYYIIPHRFRYILLLIASCVFYMWWRVELIFVILFSSFTAFMLAKKIADTEDQTKRKSFLIYNMLVSFGFLFIFKYLVFVNHNIISLLQSMNIYSGTPPEFDIILPLGISFYTFQAVGYAVDVYRDQCKPIRNYFKFLLYIMFFPQLVAGPIERASQLMPQLLAKHKFNIDNIYMGLKFIIFGLFKKIVIADRVAILVNAVYGSPQFYDGLSFIIATILFAFQIYCDFSGYSEMAIGSAKIFGINLTENFRSPYFATSIKEFWRRWHISLSTWFKDYVYIPLGGNRTSQSRYYFNIFITFMLSGVWHGANWTFILWGMLHGFYQIIGDMISKFFTFLKHDIKIILYITNILKCLVTFCLVCFAWIFFRANTISDSFYIVSNLGKGLYNIGDMQYIYNTLNGFPLSLFEMSISVACIIILLICDFFGRHNNIHVRLMSTPFIFRFFVYQFITITILALAVQTNGNQFIYFQF